MTQLQDFLFFFWPSCLLMTAGRTAAGVSVPHCSFSIAELSNMPAVVA